MNFTSHFVGITLKSKYFSEIFLEISELFGKNLDEILELQNSLSLHITLYYLPANLKNSDLEKIKKLISEIDFNQIKLIPEKLDYFREKIAYISYKNYNNLEKINKIFKNNFSNYNSILDNTYEFIPHTTIFKIKDFEKYLLYKDKIEDIVEKKLQKIGNNNIFEKVSLYAVNSEINPEKQVIIF